MKQKGTAKKLTRKAKPSAAKPAMAKRTTRKAKPADKQTFLGQLGSLLESRGIPLPEGFHNAPAEAYANQTPDVVGLLAKLNDEQLKNQAARIAQFADRKAARIRHAWNTSPLIVELRRRGLKEPPMPQRIIGAAASFRKPLREWTDSEILSAAKEWARRAT